MPHPLIDRSRGDVRVTETRAVVAYLSAWHDDLLRAAGEAGRSVVLVSDGVTRLTCRMHEALVDAGGGWVVRRSDGTLRDGFDGRLLASIGEAVAPRPVPAEDEDAAHPPPPHPAEAVQLVISLSVRHRDAEGDALGATAEVLSQALTGGSPSGWGVHEPALVAWDRTGLTATARGRLPAPTTLVVAGSGEHPSVGTIHLARTENGLEETTRLVVAVGAPGSDESRAAIARVVEALADLTPRQVPLFGVVMARAGRRDLTVSAGADLSATPVGLLIGPPGVRDLELDLKGLVARFGARVVGRPLTPGVYLPLGGPDDAGRETVDAVLDALGRDRLRASLNGAGALVEEAGLAAALPARTGRGNGGPDDAA